LRRLGADRRGASAVEFALIGSIFVVLLLNVVDFAILIWSRMQVDYAAAAAAQAAYNTCSPGNMPAKTNCPDLDSVVQTAARSTSLGGAVSLEAGSPIEEYYCTSGTNLTRVATYPATPPANCSGVEGSTPAATPGDYVTVNVSYTFTPLFAGLSLVQQQPLTAMAMQRLR
jgi:Flp pilus assembly protein TadG